MSRERAWRGSVFIATSLDGYIARHDGDIGWLTDPPPDQSHADAHDGPHPPAGYEAFMATVDHLVMGRGTYEKVLTFDDWPFPTKDVLVLSTTMTDGDPRVVVARDVATVLHHLDERGARRVYVDGGRVIQEFLRRGLIDDITITRAPVLLGEGIPLFGALRADVRLTHIGTATSGSGMTSSHYRVQH